jgi:hypothetical protein
MTTGLRQLTIDGREVPHPPPRPRVTCPVCGKLIALAFNGTLFKHKEHAHGRECSMSRRRYEKW